MYLNMKIVFLFSFYSYFAIIEGHNNKPINYADLESALMPQELDPQFTPDKDGPWRAVLPLVTTTRARRQAPASASATPTSPDAPAAPNAPATSAAAPARSVRAYSRAAALATVLIAVLVEIVDTKVEVLNVENNTNKIEETTQNTTVIAMQQSSTTDHQKTENVVASLPNQKKRRLRRKKKTKESMREGKKDETGKGDGKKTVALTTMYCPFLGIIHMVNELH
ncbi:hypothetical protein JYU34_003039 [Plutella xylostella]|uniref:Uncharacterized protein n=1 Tax=Plutella xylostella TaxID=51655 RepID=A0ABQ7QZ00_PLUXY|nr:hypothetical protein JYU34_003039 [Plutella xylostella]